MDFRRLFWIGRLQQTSPHFLHSGHQAPQKIVPFMFTARGRTVLRVAQSVNQQCGPLESTFVLTPGIFGSSPIIRSARPSMRKGWAGVFMRMIQFFGVGVNKTTSGSLIFHQASVFPFLAPSTSTI